MSSSLRAYCQLAMSPSCLCRVVVLDHLKLSQQKFSPSHWRVGVRPFCVKASFSFATKLSSRENATLEPRARLQITGSCQGLLLCFEVVFGSDHQCVCVSRLIWSPIWMVEWLLRVAMECLPPSCFRECFQPISIILPHEKISDKSNLT